MGVLSQDTDGELHEELEEQLGNFEGVGIVPKKRHAGLACAR